MSERTMFEARYYKRPVLDPAKYKRIIYDPGLVTRVILNRPRYLNASSHAELAELEDAFDRAAEDPKCNVIVLSGNGPSFCSGDDNTGLSPEGAPTLWDGDARTPAQLIKEYGSEDAVWHLYNIEHDWLVFSMPQDKLRTCPKPTIAMVHGYAIFMGAILASCMDVCFASEDALFLGSPFGIWDLGRRKSIEIAYEHRFITAREGHELGMVNRVFPNRDILEKETMAYAYRVADQSSVALRRMKEGYLDSLDDMGFSAGSSRRTASRLVWRQDAEEGHRMRYEGRGRARTPVALANLKAKLEAEGAQVPQNVREALARAAARDDRGAWQRVLHAEWRDPKRVARTDASAKAYDQYFAEHEGMKKAELERRGLLDIWNKAKYGTERVKDK